MSQRREPSEGVNVGSLQARLNALISSFSIRELLFPTSAAIENDFSHISWTPAIPGKALSSVHYSVETWHKHKEQCFKEETMNSKVILLHIYFTYLAITEATPRGRGGGTRGGAAGGGAGKAESFELSQSFSRNMGLRKHCLGLSKPR